MTDLSKHTQAEISSLQQKESLGHTVAKVTGGVAAAILGGEVLDIIPDFVPEVLTSPGSILTEAIGLGTISVSAEKYAEDKKFQREGLEGKRDMRRSIKINQIAAINGRS